MSEEEEAPTKGDLIQQALTDAGVPAGRVMSPCHWNFAPRSNLKPWTDEQVQAIREIAERFDCKLSDELVAYVGTYFRAMPPRPINKGVRFCAKSFNW